MSSQYLVMTQCTDSDFVLQDAGDDDPSSQIDDSGNAADIAQDALGGPVTSGAAVDPAAAASNSNQGAVGGSMHDVPGVAGASGRKHKGPEVCKLMVSRSRVVVTCFNECLSLKQVLLLQHPGWTCCRCTMNGALQDHQCLAIN